MAKNAIEIIFSDENILVINKPSGISVTKDRGGDADLMAVLAEQEPALEGNLRLIHRLDKLTSGVMVLAKNKDTQSLLSRAFEKRDVKKTYLAITSGYAEKTQGIVKMPIARDRKDATKMRFDKRGKAAITKWQILANFGMFLLVKASPLTGRTHQIRLHMSKIGLPLAIDPLYGGTKPVMLSDVKLKYRPKKDIPEKPLIDRLTLHAYQLELPGYEQVFIAGLDKNFAATIKMLNKHSTGVSEIEPESGVLEKILNSQKI